MDLYVGNKNYFGFIPAQALRVIIITRTMGPEDSSNKKTITLRLIETLLCDMKGSLTLVFVMSFSQSCLGTVGAISTSILVERNVVLWGDLQAFTADDREADRQRHVIRETKSWCGWALMMSGLRLNTSSKPSPNKHFFLAHFHCHYL